MEESRRAIPLLGARLREVRRIDFSFDAFDDSLLTEEERARLREFCETARFLVVLEKTRPTPAQYPRKWAQMQKKHL